MISVRLLDQNESPKSDVLFGVRVATALGISVADALDYVGAPIFDLPDIGNIADGIIIAMLYRITGSKISTAINAIDLIPIIGDLMPTYTITSLLWVLRELSRRKGNGDGCNRSRHQIMISQYQRNSVSEIMSEMVGSNKIVDSAINDSNATPDGFRTRAMRLYSIFRSRAG